MTPAKEKLRILRPESHIISYKKLLKKGEKEEDIYPTKSDSVYSNVSFPQKVALLSLPVTV